MRPFSVGFVGFSICCFHFRFNCSIILIFSPVTPEVASSSLVVPASLNKGFGVYPSPLFLFQRFYSPSRKYIKLEQVKYSLKRIGEDTMLAASFLLDENIFAKAKFYKLDFLGVSSAQMIARICKLDMLGRWIQRPVIAEELPAFGLDDPKAGCINRYRVRSC